MKLSNIFSVQIKDSRLIITFFNKTLKTRYSAKKKIELLKEEIKLRNEKLLYKIHKYLPAEKRPEALCDWYFEQTGKNLNLKNPKTFNEKIQWSKLYDTTPLKTLLADKYLVRQYVKDKIGEEYLINLYGVWDNFDDIDFDILPETFVLKCNHGSGYNIIVKDKAKFDKADAKRKIDAWMAEDYAFRYGFEMQYSDIPKKIIAEQYIQSKDKDLEEYNITCFQGKADFIINDILINSTRKRNLYDTEWNLLPYKISHYENFHSKEKPSYLEKMIDLAQKLSEGINYVRVDLYHTKGKIYFGEMTFTSSSETSPIAPESFDKRLTDLFKLPID